MRAFRHSDRRHESIARMRRARRLHRTLPLLVGLVVIALMLGGVLLASHLLGGGSSASPTPVSVPSTTTNAAPVAPIAPVGSDTQSAAAGSTAGSTFSLVLPSSATQVTHTGDSQNEDLRFRLGARPAAINSQPLPQGSTLSEWIANYQRKGVTITRFQLGERKGYLVGQTTGTTSALMAIFLHGSQLYTIQLGGLTVDAAATRAEVLKLAAAITPR